MMLLRNPIVWLLQVRHRKGYGVHSPFAFDFVTDVLYNHSSYYAYKEIDASLRWWQRARVKSMRHLLLRLANYRCPKTLYVHGVDEENVQALLLGSRGAKLVESTDAQGVDMLLLGTEDEVAMQCIAEGSMVVLWNLTRQRPQWQRLQDDERITVTFDLHDIGIAFARQDLNKQHYTINW